MPYLTTLSLSLKNLLTKKGRTFLTSFAGSIGILGICLMIIFLTDLVISFLIVLKCRKAGIENYKDDTEEMNKKVREYLIEHSILTKRFADSFPNARLRVERFKKLHDERIRKEKSK